MPEPIYVRKQGGFDPMVHLLADHGFTTYSTLIEAPGGTVQKKPELVQRLVDALILGWYAYLCGDRKATNALMLKENPETTEDELEDSVALRKKEGIVDSGEALESGIGSMNSARIKKFHDSMVRAGLFKAGEVELAKVADTQFVNCKVGLDRPNAPGR